MCRSHFGLTEKGKYPQHSYLLLNEMISLEGCPGNLTLRCCYMMLDCSRGCFITGLVKVFVCNSTYVCAVPLYCESAGRPKNTQNSNLKLHLLDTLRLLQYYGKNHHRLCRPRTVQNKVTESIHRYCTHD